MKIATRTKRSTISTSLSTDVLAAGREGQADGPRSTQCPEGSGDPRLSAGPVAGEYARLTVTGDTEGDAHDWAPGRRHGSFSVSADPVSRSGSSSTITLERVPDEA
jgi:hypothetical protein